jgi:GNAT superfamily N-acetyltransferase
MSPNDYHFITKMTWNAWVSHPDNLKRSKRHFERRIEAMLRDGQGYIMHFDDDEYYIVSFMLWRKASPKTALVHIVYTRPSYRQQGLATQMINLLHKKGIENVGYDLRLVGEKVFLPVVERGFNLMNITSEWTYDREEF